MSKLPRARYAALVAVLASALAYVPGLGEYAEQVLRVIGLSVAGLMAAAKVLREAMAGIDEDDPMMEIQERDLERPGFWRRVL